MLHLPILRWGAPYESLEKDEVVHFSSGEPIATVSRANGGLIQRDARTAARARAALRAMSIDELIDMAARAGELYANATLPMGDGTQSPDEFVRAQSASTGLPEHMCRANMKKNLFVLSEMRRILDVADARALARRAVGRLRRGTRRADQLPGAEPRRRARAAVEFARRPYAVAADHSAADRAGAQAWAAGAVDALPDDRGVLPGRRAARGDRDLSGRGRRRCGGARQRRSHDDLRRASRPSIAIAATPRSRRTGRASRRLSLATTWSIAGSSIST